jgi:hypothetical protein
MFTVTAQVMKKTPRVCANFGATILSEPVSDSAGQIEIPGLVFWDVGPQFPDSVSPPQSSRISHPVNT